MADFIDDDVEHDPASGAQSGKKKHRKRKKPANYRLDDEDREIIKENTGIELKPKNRLKRNIEKERDASMEDDKALVKKEIEVREKQQTMQIDTSKKRGRPIKDPYKAEGRTAHSDEFEQSDRLYENAEKLRQAQEIFGNDDDELELPQTGVTDANIDDVPLETVFDADEIDDPFSTPADKKIEATDICERLQVRLKDRMRPSEDEINTEAEWIFDRLTTHTSLKIDHETQRVESEFLYSMLLRKKDAKAKIIKVL